MAKAKHIEVKESITELKQLLGKHSATLESRIRMLIAIKTHKITDLSKQELAKILGVSSSSTQIWRKLYEKGGLELLLTDKRIGFKPSIITKEEHLKIEELLNDPASGLNGYVELKDWISVHFGKDIKYNTLLKYCGVNFGSKVRTARKSHIKKDTAAIEDFKKTLGKSV